MKIINCGISLILSVVTLCSCDGIKADDRYIDVPPAMVNRTVLLEDFTGQNCTNCPEAHRIIESLEEQYGDNLVAVSIHAGHFGISAANTRYTGLMQAEGQSYNDRYGIDEYPSGVVDGKLPVLTCDQWPTAVYNDISKPTPLTIGLSAVCNEGVISIDCSLESAENLDGDLFVWIVESNIVARQEDKDKGRINDYVHNNVFRACVNGLDGENLSLVVRKPQSVSYSIAVKDTDTEKWNIGNTTVVAFVKNNGGVLQAARCQIELSN